MEVKDQIKAVREVLETIEVHGKDNLRRLLACLNSLDEAIADMDRAEKEANHE